MKKSLLENRNLPPYRERSLNRLWGQLWRQHQKMYDYGFIEDSRGGWKRIRENTRVCPRWESVEEFYNGCWNCLNWEDGCKLCSFRLKKEMGGGETANG